MTNRTDASAASAEGTVTFRQVARETIRFVLSELKPKGKMLTPFNVITGVIILVRPRDDRHPVRLRAGRRLQPLPELPVGDLDRLRRGHGGGLRRRSLRPVLRRPHPEDQEVRADHPRDRPERLPRLRLLRRRPPAGPGASLERHQPHHRELLRAELRALPGGLALPAVHDLRVPGVLPGRRGVAALAEGAQDPGGALHRRRHLRDHPLDAAPVGPGSALPAGARRRSTPCGIRGISR